MKRFLLLFIFVFSFSFSKAQWVTIPDPAFVNWLQAHYSTCMSGNQMDTTCSGIVNEVSADISSQYIHDLYGIQFFKNLDTLDCTNNYLDSLWRLPDSLIYLTAVGIDLFLSSPLPNTLLYFNCSGSLGYPALPSSLKYLICQNCFISNILGLPSGLEYLDARGNDMDNLPVLPSSLTYLNCSFNTITHFINPLPTSLLIFNCGDNIDIDTLPALPPNLVNLQCNDLDNLTHLPTLPTTLQTLNCAYDYSLSYIPEFPSSLRSLNIPDCDVLTGLINLPDTLNHFNSYNTPLACFPPLLYFGGNSADIYFETDTTWGVPLIRCLPNFIQHNGYIPLIDNLPVCDFNYNPNGCDFVWNLLGNVVNDADGSCATLNDSTATKNLKVKLFDGGGNLLGQEIINSAGGFSFTTSYGAYSVSVDTSNVPFNVICPSSNNISGVISAVDSTDTGLQFRLECKPGFDVGVVNVIGNHNFFPGNVTTVNVYAGDIPQTIYGAACNSAIGGVVRIILNGLINYLGPSVGALTPTITGDTLTYNISDFSLVNANTNFAFNVLTNTIATIGDEVCFDVSVTPTAGDNNISNNTLTHCFAVSNSFDPNEKEVSPIGDLNFPFNNWLTYTIHFQNTGTAPAQHIQILDTLDSDLDESTFQLLSSSFDPKVQLFGNKVHFNFVNINLPDSTTDAEGSKGYVSYRIKPKQNLAIGTEIENTASIYFDFNTPIVTNTTLNTIVHENGVSELAVGNLQLAVYPNPAESQLAVYSEQLAGATIFITDIFGRELLRVKANLNSQIINLKSLPSGFYFVKVQMQNGEVVVRKFVKE